MSRKRLKIGHRDFFTVWPWKWTPQPGFLLSSQPRILTNPLFWRFSSCHTLSHFECEQQPFARLTVSFLDLTSEWQFWAKKDRYFLPLEGKKVELRPLFLFKYGAQTRSFSQTSFRHNSFLFGKFECSGGPRKTRKNGGNFWRLCGGEEGGDRGYRLP